MAQAFVESRTAPESRRVSMVFVFLRSRPMRLGVVLLLLLVVHLGPVLVMAYLGPVLGMAHLGPVLLAHDAWMSRSADDSRAAGDEARAVRHPGMADPVGATAIPGPSAVVGVPVDAGVVRDDGPAEARAAVVDRHPSALIGINETGRVRPAAVGSDRDVAPAP